MRILVLLLIYNFIIVAISGCGVSAQAIALLSQPAATPIAAIVTPTLAPLATLTPALSPTATPTPDLSSAIIRLQDLPSGFESVSTADLGKFNFSESSIADSFSQFATQARPKNLFVFVKNNPKLELVVGFVLSPLSSSDRAAMDLSLSNPDSVLQTVAAGFAMGGRTIKSSNVIPAMDKFGDRSVGVTAIPTTESQPLRMDAVVARRGPVAEIVCLIYSDGSPPSLAVGAIAQMLDTRVSISLGR